ncbi:hypothetical protein CKAH01_03945 [Colletotrichum kahawae]|uniref:Uncharacterized protein n=1 Tax=Colletotrichum kahawae TaxID=34407 RepID=A0AAD9YNK4_COLKA|nr:hypothetical protein CKAH01_03945 [Colletotrichum kahawae]
MAEQLQQQPPPHQQRWQQGLSAAHLLVRFGSSSLSVRPPTSIGTLASPLAFFPPSADWPIPLVRQLPPVSQSPGTNQPRDREYEAARRLRRVIRISVARFPPASCQPDRHPGARRIPSTRHRTTH